MNNDTKKRKVLRVLLVCGSGIVSSEMVAPRVEDILSELINKNYVLSKGRIYDIERYASEGRIDVVLSTVAINSDMLSQTKVPIIIVTDLLMGKKERVTEALKKVLLDRDNQT